MSQATQSPSAQSAAPRSTSAAVAPAGTAVVAVPAKNAAALGLDLPSRLVRVRLLAALIALVFAAITVTQLLLSYQSVQSAAVDTAQLVRVQDIRVHLLRADAVATNTFLVGGLEPPAQRATFNESMDAAVRGITDASQAQPLDRAVLSELNLLVMNYAGGIETARANNRLGLPVGAAYLRSSSAELRTHGIPLLDALVDANEARARASLDRQFPVLVVLPGILALGGLFLLNRWLATRFHRHINLGLAGAAAIIAVLTIAATAASALQSSENSRLKTGEYATAVTGASVRADANEAKSNESLRLIARGSGQEYEAAWTANAQSVTEGLSQPALSSFDRAPWDAYTAGHTRAVELDDGGDWDGAVALVTSNAEGDPTPEFRIFDDTLESTVTTAKEAATEKLTSGRVWFVVFAVVTALGGVVAAGLAWGGVTARLEEYL